MGKKKIQGLGRAGYWLITKPALVPPHGDPAPLGKRMPGQKGHRHLGTKACAHKFYCVCLGIKKTGFQLYNNHTQVDKDLWTWCDRILCILTILSE